MEPYTEQELFNLRQVVVEPDTVLDRFKCVLTCTVDGKESIVGKRKWKVAEVKGEGYIGFDAYNHCVPNEITERVRITYVGKDYIVIFFRSPAKGNVPTLYRVALDNNDLVHQIDAGNGVTYRLITTVRAKEAY